MTLMLIWSLLLLVRLAPAVHADSKLSKEDQRWLQQEVAPLITPEEIEIFKDIDITGQYIFYKDAKIVVDPGSDQSLM